MERVYHPVVVKELASYYIKYKGRSSLSSSLRKKGGCGLKRTFPTLYAPHRSREWRGGGRGEG